MSKKTSGGTTTHSFTCLAFTVIPLISLNICRSNNSFDYPPTSQDLVFLFLFGFLSKKRVPGKRVHGCMATIRWLMREILQNYHRFCIKFDVSKMDNDFNDPCDKQPH